jgi:diacylglycerol kinase (ATP)
MSIRQVLLDGADLPGINPYADGEYVCPVPVTLTAVPRALKILRP